MKKLLIICLILLASGLFAQVRSNHYTLTLWGLVDNNITALNGKNVYIPNNFGIGTSTFPTSLAGGLAIANGTAPTAGASGVAGFYVSAGELYGFDSSGNTSQVMMAGDWAEPLPAYIMDGSDDYARIQDDGNLNFYADGEMSVEVYFKTKDDITTQQTVVDKYWGIYSISISNGKLRATAKDSGSTNHIIATSSNIETNTAYHSIMTISNTNGTFKLYVNGVEENSMSYFPLLNTLYYLNIGNRQSDTYFDGDVYFVRIYNRALTASEVTDHWNNGQPDKYELPYADMGASNTTIATYDSSQAVSDAFTLLIEKNYKWTKGNADSLTINGSTVVVSGADTSFIATASAGTAYGDLTGSSLIPIGNVLDLRAENAGSMGWLDASGNGLHAVTSGSPIAPQKKRDYKSGVGTTAVEFVNSQKSETLLKGIILTTASGSPTTISLGTSTAATEILSAQTFTTGDFISVNKYSQSERSLYAKCDAGTVNITFIYEKVAQ